MDVLSESVKGSNCHKGFSPDILRNDGDEKFAFENKPEPDILQISSLVDEYKSVDENCLKGSWEQFLPSLCHDQCNKQKANNNKVFNEGFFSLITDPRTLDFLISLGDCKQEQNRKPSFHSKFQKYLQQRSFSGQQMFHYPKHKVKETASSNKGESYYAFQDAPHADVSRKNVLEHFRRIIPSRAKNISNIKSVEDKKMKVEELKHLLKKTNEERKELESNYENYNQQMKLELLVQQFDSQIMNITKSAEETKLFLEEWKGKMMQDLKLVKDFTVQTQQAYINLQAKQKRLLEVIEAEQKFVYDLTEKEREIVFDLEEANKKYIGLKSRAEKELNEANKEYTDLDSVQQQEIHKLEFDIKRKYCTISALEDALDSKRKEHQALQVLCEELMKSQ